MAAPSQLDPISMNSNFKTNSEMKADSKDWGLAQWYGPCLPLSHPQHCEFRATADTEHRVLAAVGSRVPRLVSRALLGHSAV